MKKIPALLITFFVWAAAHAQSVGQADLEKIRGQWTGSLTYLDYTSNKSETVQASLEVSMKNKTVFMFAYSYPNEPGRGGKEKFKLSENGSKINNMKVIERIEQPEGGYKIVLEEKGKDGNEGRTAIFRHIFEKKDQQLTITKMVKFEGTDDFFQRNQYQFKR
ncbi:MAG: hypothetical protein IPL84_09070 [Chitinophagaceae bacterium]|nr:hypothetical protein [Chitinophagaceae bacterium]